MGHRVVLGVQRPCLARVAVPPLLLLLVLLSAAVWAESHDYYNLLKVNREATTREIRQAFKKLALTMHPDKNPVSYSKKPQTTTLDVPPNTHVLYKPC